MNTPLSNIERISLLTSDKELSTIKTILNFLKDKHPNFKVMKFRTGKIGEHNLVSFKVEHKFYAIVLEKFAYNAIPVIMRDKRAKEFIDHKKEEKRRNLQVQGWAEISTKRNPITLEELEKLAENGKLKEIIREAKGGIGSDRDIVQKAQSLISQTVENAIGNLINFALEKPGRCESIIDELLLIASDKDLKIFGKNEEMRNAGIASIELALGHKYYFDKIIRIANDPKLENIINIKAAIALADNYSSNKEENPEKLPNAVKHLNTRWLKIALETVRSKILGKDVEKLNSFIRFIEEQRQAA